MSAAGSTSSSTSIDAATSRLGHAVRAPKTGAAAHTDSASSSDAPTRGSSTPPSDAERGAAGAPDFTATGADAAETGAGSIGDTGMAPTPAEASADAYAAEAAGSVSATGGGTGTAYIEGTGAWSPENQRRFEKLQLAPADIAFLAKGNFDQATLDQIAAELEAVDVVDPSAGAGTGTASSTSTGMPVEGVDAGSASSANGPTAGDVMAPGQPGSSVQATSAWSPEWASKFTDVLTRMGLPQQEIDSQLQAMEGQPVTEEQLGEAYRQMEQSIGAFDDEWKGKFEKLFDELKAPQADRDQALAQLAGSGLTEEQLQQAYDDMAKQKPGWNDTWESKFHSLDIPEDMMKQLKESGAPEEALSKQFDELLETKMKFKNDGRLDKLMDAGASSEEKWGIMLQKDLKDEDFDKAVEGIRASNVSAWKRVLSVGVNMIPGVYALQYITGKDWITGDKIDRGNPLNIIGAVGSGFSAFSAVRGAIAGVQGLRAAQAGYTAAKAAGEAGQFSAGAMQAIEGANLVTKFDKGLRVLDYVKSATPIVNRFGEAKALAGIGRGYFQGMQLASGAAAMQKLADGSVVVDKATKSQVLAELKQGKSIEQALGGVQRSAGGVNPALSNAQVTKMFTQNGFIQSPGGLWKFNPLKRDATIAVGETSANGTRVMELGRGVNFASKGGLAQGIGTVQAANIAKLPEAMQASAFAATGAQASHAANVGTDGALITKWADQLGVTGGSRFRALTQLDGSSRAARQISRAAENGGSKLYQAVSRIAAIPGNSRMLVPSIYGGAAIGLLGKQMQPGWEMVKEDPGLLVGRSKYDAEREAARDQADAEQAELERLWQERQAGGGAQTTGTGPGAGDAAATATQQQVVGTSPSGGQLVAPPELGGMLVDTSNGDVYDPNSGQVVGNMSQVQSGGSTASAAAPTTAGGGVQSSGGGGMQSSGGVHQDPTTGYYVDEATGLMADPATGNVYDPRTGQVVANLGAAGAPAA